MIPPKMSFPTKANYCQLILGDCRQVLFDELMQGRLPVDLIFADPPFNVDAKYPGFYDKKTDADHGTFTDEWIRLCCGRLSVTGSLWINCSEAILLPIMLACRSYGLRLRRQCIWYYRFGQCSRANFVSSHSNLLYYTSSNVFTWHPERILEPSDRASKYNDKRTQKSQTPGMRVPLDVWEFSRIQGNNIERRRNHPNQMPEMLLARIIAACSNEGDSVLDPFCGSGTTAVVARAMNRNVETIDISMEVLNSASARMSEGPKRDFTKFLSQQKGKEKP